MEQKGTAGAAPSGATPPRAEGAPAGAGAEALAAAPVPPAMAVPPVPPVPPVMAAMAAVPVMAAGAAAPGAVVPGEVAPGAAAPGAEGGAGLDARVASLLARLEALEVSGRDAARRAELERALAPLPEPLRAPLRGAYRLAPLGRLEDSAWGAELARVAGEVSALARELSARGLSFTPPGGGAAAAGGPREATGEELKALLARARL